MRTLTEVFVKSVSRTTVYGQFLVSIVVARGDFELPSAGYPYHDRIQSRLERSTNMSHLGH